MFIPLNFSFRIVLKVLSEVWPLNGVALKSHIDLFEVICVVENKFNTVLSVVLILGEVRERRHDSLRRKSGHHFCICCLLLSHL